MDPLSLVILYAHSFAGNPYRFGGNNPLQGGMDCSGYVCEVLRYAGVVGNKEDLTAQELFDRFFITGSVGVREPGSLAFYGASPAKIAHVALLTSRFQILEAGGGDSTTDSIAEAAARNAMVRGRLLNYRTDLVNVIKPRYGTIGLI